MNKSYLLSGMMIVVSVMTVNAMDNRRQAAWRAIDNAVHLAGGINNNWNAVFKVLDSKVINVNEYKDPIRGEPLIHIALNDYLDYLSGSLAPGADLSIMQRLFEQYKADPNVTDIEGLSVMDYARISGDIRLINLIQKAQQKNRKK